MRSTTAVARGGPGPDELRETMRACRGAFVALASFSAFANLLMLTLPLYMLQVFDRVLASRSTDTLIVLSLIAAAALLTLAVLEGLRSLALVRIGAWLDRRLGSRVLQASVAGTLERSGGSSAQGLRDLATFRSFVAGPSMLPILDAPWTPIFIAVAFALNPLLGCIAVAGAAVLLALAVANELATRGPVQRAGAAQIAAMQQAEAAARNADAIEAMGMLDNVARRWERRNADAIALHARASARSGAIAAASKLVRLLLQTGMLGTGAWLVIQHELSAGGMIAATILLGRALAPVDQAIGSWRALVAARAARRRLHAQLERAPRTPEVMSLPRPRGELRCEGVTYVRGDAGEPALRNIGFHLPAGKVLGLVGASGSGKTTLARLLVGSLQPRLGHVRLDGMDIAQWCASDRGRHIGYLPQSIELFAGTVRENIARMGEADPEAVLEAARVAGVHELIMRLPKGYETDVGEAGGALSGGQRQRIALARALYGNPSLVVLDEPNSNLDQAGVQELVAAIGRLKAAGTTVVIIAYHPIVLRQVDFLMVLGSGTVQLRGPRDEVIAKVTGPHPAAAPAPRVSAVRADARG